ncbi:rhodanese-like domain-containing protein [Candidatus Pelagibacter bacterium]|nr:rhodanese-like domain-containing protein [Candidatus Pelagibacter bacterium]
MSLVTTKWLEDNFDKVKIIDCSWHMPQTNRNGFEEYKKQHIQNSIFFDLDKNSKKNTDLPHMLTDFKSWKSIISSMGIKNEDRIVIYDNSDVVSSCRCWYNFIYFGHNPILVHVLDGGLKKWIKENKTTTANTTKIIKSNYKVTEKKELVKNKVQIDKNISKKEFNVIDARSKDRFEGKVTEPRKGLKSGSIQNSFCLPFLELLNDDKTFISKDKIFEKFQSTKCDLNKNLVFSCGSGVTASVLALAYSLIENKYMPTIYDGSWSEYGKF